MPVIAIPIGIGLAEAAAWVAAAVGVTAAGYGAYKGGEYLANQMAEADSAADQAETKSVTITCATCAQNPCAELACGVPGSKYRGGAHGCVGVAENKIGDKGTIHSHHMPADAYSPLARPVGPSIQMLDVDHRLTSSYGSKVHGPPYAPQRTALASGQTMQAIRMDIRNARNVAAAQGDPTRYDDAIDQMMRYALCLKENGIIQ